MKRASAWKFGAGRAHRAGVVTEVTLDGGPRTAVVAIGAPKGKRGSQLGAARRRSYAIGLGQGGGVRRAPQARRGDDGPVATPLSSLEGPPTRRFRAGSWSRTPCGTGGRQEGVGICKGPSPDMIPSKWRGSALTYCKGPKFGQL